MRLIKVIVVAPVRSVCILSGHFGGNDKQDAFEETQLRQECSDDVESEGLTLALESASSGLVDHDNQPKEDFYFDIRSGLQ